MKIFLLAIIFIALIVPVNGDCFVYGISNFDKFNQYPGHKCGFHPIKPDAYATFGVKIYNEQKRAYEIDVLRYTHCMEQYIEAAKNDIERIKEIINDTVMEHNRRPF